jgi:tRNA-dihydrouridine synthase 4
MAVYSSYVKLFLYLTRLIDFTISPTSPPTIAQFGSNSPLELSRATTLIAPYVNGVDLNCGCPQSWACAETLGAALMHKRELVSSMVSSAKSAIAQLGLSDTKTVSVKIRVHKDLRETVDFVKTMETAGVDFITIHGRLRSTPSSKPVDMEAIKLVAEHISVPTISNGDVFTLADAKRHAAELGVDGVMSARGLLQNPALFKGYDNCPWEAVELFMSKVVRMPIPFKLVVHHLSEMCGTDHSQGKAGEGPLFDKEMRRGLMECGSMLELIDWLDTIRELRRL